MIRGFTFCFLFCFTFCQSAAATDDWRQWGGANRDFRVNVEKLPEQIKFQETWRRELGPGYSATLFENDKLFTMYRKGDDEVVICLAARSGKTVWQHQYPAPMKKGAETSFGKGPNSTPILTTDSIISVGFNGDLFCLDKKTGQPRWKKNLINDLGGTNVDLGYSQSPIIYNGNLILPVGGKQKGIVALNLDDGFRIWSAQDFKNSYSTPVLATVDGLDQMIFVMTDEVVSIDPNHGKLFWKFPLKNQWSTHAFVPVWDADSKTLFISSFRQSHGLKLKRDGDKISFETKWSNPKSGIGFTNAVIVNGVVIGSTGGSGSSVVTGIELKTGKFLWRERGFGTSNYLAIGDRVILLDEKGNLGIAKPNTSALNVIQKQKILNAPKAWTVPTLVGNRLSMRDQKEIVHLELK